MNHIYKTAYRTRQRGAALFTALIMLVAVTLVTLASLGTSLLELRMSGNEEMTMQAFQISQAGIDEIIRDHSNNVSVIGDVGYIRCTANYTDTCDDQIITIPVTVPFLDPDTSDTSNISVAVERITKDQPVPAGLGTGTGSSATTFSIRSKYNKAWRGAGIADTVQGFMKLTPKVDNSGDGAPITADVN